MICAWCERSSLDCLPLFMTPQAEAFGRYLPEVSQQEQWCPLCRSKVAVLIERVLDHVRKEHVMPVVCCVCHKILAGAVSHGYCPACAKTEKKNINAGSPRASVGLAIFVAMAGALMLLAGCKPLAAILPQHPLNPKPGQIYEIAWPVKVNVYLTNPETGKKEIRQMLASPEGALLVGKTQKEISHE